MKMIKQNIMRVCGPIYYLKIVHIFVNKHYVHINEQATGFLYIKRAWIHIMLWILLLLLTLWGLGAKKEYFGTKCNCSIWFHSAQASTLGRETLYFTYTLYAAKVLIRRAFYISLPAKKTGLFKITVKNKCKKLHLWGYFWVLNGLTTVLTEDIMIS